MQVFKAFLAIFDQKAVIHYVKDRYFLGDFLKSRHNIL